MSAVWPIVFLISLFLLFSIPLAPAINEWVQKKDAQPLTVDRDYDGNISHFASAFRSLIADRFSDALNESLLTGQAHRGTLSTGVVYQIVGSDGKLFFDIEADRSSSSSNVILSAYPLYLRPRTFFEAEVYSAQQIISGNFNIFRAILADGDIQLGSNNYLLRWAHTATTIRIKRQAHLYGRISAGKAIMLADGCQFSRMFAPYISFGTPTQAAPINTTPLNRLMQLKPSARLLDHSINRWLVQGHLKIPAHAFHRGNLVALGKLTVGSGTCILGSLKSNGDMRLEGNLRIDGAVVSAKNLYIGPGCRIKGPVVAENIIHIETNTVIGSLLDLTTITAPNIEIALGSVAHGTVWAREKGLIIAAKRTKLG